MYLMVYVNYIIYFIVIISSFQKWIISLAFNIGYCHLILFFNFLCLNFN